MSHDDEEEVVEEVVEDEHEEEHKPRRRMPRRAASTDGGVPVGSGKPRRAMRRAVSGDGSKTPSGPPMRRMATDGSAAGSKHRKGHYKSNNGGTTGTPGASEDEDEMSHSESRGGARRAVPGRSKSGDGSGGAAAAGSSRNLPGRSRSGTFGIPTRAMPGRSMSGFGRSTPRRTKSSDGEKHSFGGLRKGRKKGSSAQPTEGLLNIFGSDLVSTEKVLEDIEKASGDIDLVRLELEDFFMADREDPEAIPMALKELLEQDDRPWEGVQFMDDIMDGSCFEDFRDRKKHFMKVFAGVCEARLIPCTYKAKITLSSGSLNMDEMVELLFFLRSERSVTELTLKSEQVDESIIHGLTELFKADKRKWISVKLQLSGSGPGKPGSPEHNSWAKAMQKATVEMQKIAKERGINLG